MHYTLCDSILDLVQNSWEAGAETIELRLMESAQRLDFILKDNGCGMTQEELKRVIDPFYTDGIKHRERKVGLGLPFLQQMLEITGESLDISSVKGEGTLLKASFNLEHMDTSPVGDIPSLFLQAFTMDGPYQMIIEREKQGMDYRLDRHELIEVLGDFNQAQTMVLLRDFISSQEDEA
ncbi:MAG: ATP-binding protein [Spirochaetaceae bacterium]|jgi:hypothetical protein|nr:ATP-binding protein [Spirochaetaceae bacterium]